MTLQATELRKAAEGLRKEAEQLQIANAIKCAQVLTGAKGLLQLAGTINKLSADLVGMPVSMPGATNVTGMGPKPIPAAAPAPAAAPKAEVPQFAGNQEALDYMKQMEAQGAPSLSF